MSIQISLSIKTGQFTSVKNFKTRLVFFEDSGIILVVTVSSILYRYWKSVDPLEYPLSWILLKCWIWNWSNGHFFWPRSISCLFDIWTFYRRWLFARASFQILKLLWKPSLEHLIKILKMNYLGLNSVIEKVTNSSYGSPTQSRRGEKVAIHGTKSCGDQPK